MPTHNDDDENNNNDDDDDKDDGEGSPHNSSASDGYQGGANLQYTLCITQYTIHNILQYTSQGGPNYNTLFTLLLGCSILFTLSYVVPYVYCDSTTV